MNIFIFLYFSVWLYIKYKTELEFPPSELKFNYGALFNLNSFWIGLHYSKSSKCYSLNLLPFFTIWWVKKERHKPFNI